MYCWKGLGNTFPNLYSTLKNSQNSSCKRKKKKKKCGSLMIANHGGQKNHNGKTIGGPFLHNFLLVTTQGTCHM